MSEEKLKAILQENFSDSGIKEDEIKVHHSHRLVEHSKYSTPNTGNVIFIGEAS
jgi:hypothetical protein